MHDVLFDASSDCDVLVADLVVAHPGVAQAYLGPADANERAVVTAREPVIDRCPCKFDGVSVARLGIAVRYHSLRGLSTIRMPGIWVAVFSNRLRAAGSPDSVGNLTTGV